MTDVPEIFVEMGGRGILRSLTMPEVEGFVLAAQSEAAAAIAPVLNYLATGVRVMLVAVCDEDTDDANATRIACERFLALLHGGEYLS